MQAVINTAVWVLRFATLSILLYSCIAVVDKGFSASIGGVPFTKGRIYIALRVVLVLMLLLEIIRAKDVLAGKKFYITSLIVIGFAIFLLLTLVGLKIWLVMATTAIIILEVDFGQPHMLMVAPQTMLDGVAGIYLASIPLLSLRES